jgi:uncharacterized protein (UPF0548 family)
VLSVRIVRRHPDRLTGLLAAYSSRELTYPEAGSSLGDLPAGYHHVRRSRRVGAGTELFDRAGERVLRFGLQRGAGLDVVASTETAQPGTTVLTVLPLGPVGILAPCRVVWVLDEPRRRGFAYGTLPGHPVSGEEAFVLERSDDGSVVLTIAAFSRHHSPLTRAAGPVGRFAQRLVIGRYEAALTRPGP